jgi:polyphosphate kinase
MLELAEDATVPLRERVGLLADIASNLDEFFSLRVAGPARRLATGLRVETATRRRPAQAHEHTFKIAGELMLGHAACFHEAVQPALTEQGIEILRWAELSGAERQRLHRLFHDRIYPVMTPLLVDSAHPFPYISGLSLNLAVVIADSQAPRNRFARVKVPLLLPRFLGISPHRFVPPEDVIAAHLTRLFEGMEVLEHHVFRVTRGQELEIGGKAAGDPMQDLERELLGRLKGPVVRLEVEDSISGSVLDWLTAELGIGKRAVYRLPGPLDLTGLRAIAELCGARARV